MDAQLSQGHCEPRLTLIELFALSGAGKTTVVKAVADRAIVTTRKDLSAEWAACSVLGRLAHIGRALASARRALAAARFVSDAQVTTREGRFRLLRLVVKAEWLRSRSGLVVLDQGMLQDIWSIFLSSHPAAIVPSVIAPLIRSLYTGIDATVVVLNVEPEVASARILARDAGNSRFDGLPEVERGQSLAAAHGLQQAIVEAARLASVPIVTIDADVPAKVVADRLIDLLSAAARRKGPLLGGTLRISVVGATGSGKTTLARKLAGRLNLPLYELDRIRCEAASETSAQSFRDRVSDVVQRDQWIVDGHYRDVRHLIWRRAEMVVWLNYPLPTVALRLARRFRHKGSVRASGAERLIARPATDRAAADGAASWTMRLKRMVRTVRERRAYGRLLRSAEYQGVQIIELRSIKATQQWLRNL